jgi:hypothetical protein
MNPEKRRCGCLGIERTFLSFTSARAASDPEDGGNLRLEKLLRGERTALEKQGERLERTAENITKVETLIEKAKAKGIDTTALEASLVTYQERLVSFRECHNKAASLLATPVGFDANGKVTDRKEALKTLRQAGEALRRAHLEITEASMDLRAAVRVFVDTNKPAGTAAKP